VSLVLAEHSSKLAMDGLSFIPSGICILKDFLKEN
jgi:hypothetical protein